jgi:hypothetical protein
MLCPNCLKEVHMAEVAAVIGAGQQTAFLIVPEDRKGDIYYHLFRAAFCPVCHKIILIYSYVGISQNLQGCLERPINNAGEVVFPARAALKPAPPEVPPEYKQEFDESRLVIDLSPKSSAALSRRLLQRILHERFSIKKPNLHQEIQEFISTMNPPTHLSEQLDAIRVVGNFAAHPMKDAITGEIADVEPGEADWLIETLDDLFDFAFVQPVRSADRKASLNAKLSAAGKPTIP